MSKTFFICMNLNKKVALKIIQQHKDLILYHWNCRSQIFMYLDIKKKLHANQLSLTDLSEIFIHSLRN